MKGQVIGKTMPHGYAGSYSRQPGKMRCLSGRRLCTAREEQWCLLVEAALRKHFWGWLCAR